MASIAPMPKDSMQNAGSDVGKPGQQLLPGYVVKLLKTLKIPFGTDRSMNNIDVDPTVMLINHVIDCLGALRDINKIYRAKGSLASRSVGTRVMFGFTAELGNILLDSINFEPPKDLSDSSIFYGQIAGSILGVFPEIAAQVTPSTGKVLIHHTALKCSSTMAMESMKLVVKAFPAGAWTADRTGALPLHWVTHNPNCNQEMVNYLVNANPKGPWVADMDGYLPLHWAVNQDIPNIDVIAALIAANASASAKACSKGSLPLHWCVNRPQPHVGVMRALLQVHPDGVRTFDKTGWLPIHQCVNRSDISLEALQLLIELYPQGLQCPNVNGQLPIHRALDQNPPNAEAVHMMLEGFPGAAKVADDEGYLPVHLALDCARPDPFIARILLEQYPESAFHKSKDGLLPLHCVISSMTPVVEIIEMLLRIFPDSTESMAVDVVPIDEMADPETWEGEWMEKRWTPLSRAIDRGLDAIVMLFRDALNGAKQFNGTHLHNGPPGPSNASMRHLQPQSAPPINNLMDTQFAAANNTNTYGGPSTSSGDFMTRNLNTGSLVLGGNLDSPSRGAPYDDDYDGNGNGPPSRPTARPMTGPTVNSMPVPLRERAPGGMGPNPANLSRAPSMSDLKIRGSEHRDRDHHRDRDRDRESSRSRRPGTGDKEHHRRESSRREHHRRESRREDSSDRDNGGRDDSRRHTSGRRSTSRKGGGHGHDDGTGGHRSSKERHHSRTRESDSERDIYPSETSEAINDDGGGGSRPRSHRDNRHHSSKHSSSKHRRDHHRPQERIYENDYEQEYDDMEAQEAVVPSPGNISERGPGGRHPKLKIMSAGAVPPTDAPPRSLLEAAIGRPKSQRGVEERDPPPHQQHHDRHSNAAHSTAIDIHHDSRDGSGNGGGRGYASNAPLINKLSIDEIV